MSIIQALSFQENLLKTMFQIGILTITYKYIIKKHWNFICDFIWTYISTIKANTKLVPSLCLNLWLSNWKLCNDGVPPVFRRYIFWVGWLMQTELFGYLWQGGDGLFSLSSKVSTNQIRGVHTHFVTGGQWIVHLIFQG